MTIDERNNLVVDNMDLVTYIIKKYIFIGEDDFEDLFQEGCLALVIAAERFNPDFGVKFGTYATSMVLNTLRTYKSRKTNSKHGLVMSRKWQEEHVAITTTAKNLNMSLDSIEDLTYLLDTLNIKSHAFINCKSCDTIIKSDGHLVTFGNFIESPNNELESVELSLLVGNMITVLEKNLPTKMFNIIVPIIYEYLDTGDVKTQQEYAVQFNISQAHISRLFRNCNKILKKAKFF